MTQRDSATGRSDGAPQTEEGVEPVEQASGTEAPSVGRESDGAGDSSPVVEVDSSPAAETADLLSDAADEPPSLEEQFEGAQEQCRRTREQLLRTAADFDNFRKRSRRETEEARRRGTMQTIRDLLLVFDNLERAASVTSTPETAAIAEGLGLVLRQFLDALKKLGVDRIAVAGVPFDPTAHESIQLVESAEHEAGSVVTVVQPGYRMGSDLIRPAMVVVSKGPPVVVEAPADGEPAPEHLAPPEADAAAATATETAPDEDPSKQEADPS